VSEWETFVALIGAEAKALADLEQSALKLTDALVQNEPEVIEATERRVEAYAVLHASAYQQRTGMQKRGFGQLTLQQVAAYAPPAMRRAIYGYAHEIGVRRISLKLTVANNKSLIVAGMERLARTVALMQRAGSEQPGTYKRRGTVPAPNGSVIVSRRA
jgi:hypothetical protein